MASKDTPPFGRRLLGALKLLLGAFLVGLPLHLAGVPAGMLLGSIIGAAVVNQQWFPVLTPSELPRPIRHVDMIAVGLISGVLLTTESLVTTASVALPIMLTYLGLVILNLGFVTILMKRYQVDPVTAVLALTPGGLGEITSMAMDKGAQVAVVLTIHSVRLFVIVLLILPVLVLVFAP